MTLSPLSATPSPARAAASTRLGRADATPEGDTPGFGTAPTTLAIKVLLGLGGLTREEEATGSRRMCYPSPSARKTSPPNRDGLVDGSRALRARLLRAMRARDCGDPESGSNRSCCKAKPTSEYTK